MVLLWATGGRFFIRAGCFRLGASAWADLRAMTAVKRRAALAALRTFRASNQVAARAYLLPHPFLCVVVLGGVGIALIRTTEHQSGAWEVFRVAPLE